jgi:hypothetical protein
LVLNLQRQMTLFDAGVQGFTGVSWTSVVMVLVDVHVDGGSGVGLVAAGRRERLVAGWEVSLDERDGEGLEPTRYVDYRMHVDFEDYASLFDGQVHAAEGQAQRSRRGDGQLGECGREVVDGNGGGHRTPALVARRVRIGLHMFADSEHPIVEDDDAELVATSVVIDVAGVAGDESVLAWCRVVAAGMVQLLDRGDVEDVLTTYPNPGSRPDVAAEPVEGLQGRVRLRAGQGDRWRVGNWRGGFDRR